MISGPCVRGTISGLQRNKPSVAMSVAHVPRRRNSRDSRVSPGADRIAPSRFPLVSSRQRAAPREIGHYRAHLLIITARELIASPEPAHPDLHSRMQASRAGKIGPIKSSGRYYQPGAAGVAHLPQCAVLPKRRACVRLRPRPDPQPGRGFFIGAAHPRGRPILRTGGHRPGCTLPPNLTGCAQHWKELHK